ncbi:MAG: hypothetical protein EXR48_03510 [Dehalococcoidia bacterium]|nr:hypothetical protein [Dehalococcoidia bacterium]
MYWVLMYDYVDDMLTRRAPYREQHLTLARQHHQRGQLVMAGALENPLDGALLVFRVDNARIVEEFVAADPYVKNGLVTRWRMRNWNVVIGA